MRLIFAAFFAVFFASTASAQEYDLRTIPPDFSFVSIGNDGITRIVYLGYQDGYYRFQQSTDYNDGSRWNVIISLNQQSQTVISESAQDRRVYTPHDCAPSLGECSHTIEQDGKIYQERRTTILVDGVYFARVYAWIDAQWVQTSKSCTTFDQYGFWVDYVVMFDDDTELWGYRDTPGDDADSTERINRLRRICAPPELLS